jgi:hypothetical protein
MLTLTRFLYSKDEVELSLLTALLKNEELDIIYYWAYELYYSGFDIFEYLWKIYLDFYYERNPHVEAYFIKKQTLWRGDKNMIHVAYILRNMYKLPITSTVFMARQLLNTDISLTHIYKFTEAKIPERLQGYATIYRNLWLAWERRHMENVWYYLKRLANTTTTSALAAVIGQFLQVDIRSDSSLHYLVAVLGARHMHMHMHMHTQEKKKHIFVVPKQEQLTYFAQLEQEQIPLTIHGGPQIYNTLMFKRRVAIDDHIGAFELARWTWAKHEDYEREHWFHWEYYAMGAPLWLKRLTDFGGWINPAQKQIEFATEQQHDAFYDLYAYELDELPKEVQAMSMKPINKTDGSTWYNYIFNTNLVLPPGETWHWVY